MEITTTTLPPFQLEPNLNLTTSVSKKFNTPIIFEPNTPIKAIPDLNRLVFTDFKPSYGPIRTSWIGENVIHQIPAPIRTKKKKGKKKGKKKIRVKIQPTVKDNNINNGSGKSQSGNTETGTKNEGYLDKLVKMMGLLTGIWTGYLSEDSPNHINDYETGYSPNHIETGNSPDLIAAKQGQSGFSGGPVMGLVGTFGLGLAGWSLFNSGSLSFRSARGLLNFEDFDDILGQCNEEFERCVALRKLPKRIIESGETWKRKCRQRRQKCVTSKSKPRAI